MKKTKRNYLFILVIAVLVITIGYALLSQSLGINGVSTIKNSKWDIYWDDTSIVENSNVTATTSAHVSNQDKNIVEFAVNFEVPGDYYEFTIDAKNAGTIDGTINKIEKGIYEDDGVTVKELPDYLEYTVTYADDTMPTPGDVLLANTSKKYKVRLTYKTNSTTIPLDDDITTYKVKIDYQQTTDKKE